MKLSQVIKEPLITEKSMDLAGKGRYCFVVDKRVNKHQIKQAVEKFFKVNVVKVRTMKVLGKSKRTGKYLRKISKRPDWKKAIVELKKGEKIDIFSEAGG